MAILTLRVKGQTLTVESKIDKIVENSVNYLDCDIICDDENWDTLAKKIILKYDKIVQSLYGDKQVKIPFAAIRQPGFTISVIGYSLKEGKQESDPDAFEERITTHPVTIKVFASGPVEGQELEEPIIYATSLDSLGAAINKKIDIDNITQVIDNNSEESKVPSAKATYNAIADLKKDTIKIITGPCHIADLEAGIYMVKNDFIGEESDCRVTFSNVKADGTIYENYFSLESGLLIVFDNIKSMAGNGTETSTVAFTAQGSMNIPNQYHKDVEDIAKYTIENAISVTCYWLESTKYSQDTGSHKANKWYSGLSDFSFSDIPATAIIDEITPESTRYNIPSAVAVRNYVNEQAVIKSFDKANVWELEAGAYYITESINIAYDPVATQPAFMYKTIYTYGTTGFLFVDIDIKVNDTRNFYFIVGGNLYVGSTMPGEVTILPDNENEEPIKTIAANGSYTRVKAEFVDDITNTSKGIATAKGVYNFGENIKTELLANIGNKADKTEVETALMGKVDKSDVLSNIDKNAQPEDIYNAPIVNTALATLEQGIFKALPSDTVNVWELESGLYRVTANTTINNGINSTLIKPANPYSYLYVSGKSYTGTTDQRYVVGWAYLASIIYENSFVAKVFTGATYTDGTVKEHASELATVTKLTALETKLGNEFKTALNGKVDKSDILTVIDTAEVYTDNQFYNANAVNSVLDLLVDKNNILTEINYNASADEIYNARVINGITQQINETFATKAYVNEVIGGIENGSY